MNQKILAIVIIRIIEKLTQKYFTLRAEMFAVPVFAAIDVFTGNFEQISHIAPNVDFVQENIGLV